MLIGYIAKKHALAFAIGGSHGGAAFLTDSQAMCDGQDGLICSIQWIGGTQSTASYVDITVTISSPLDAVAAVGVVGVSNVVGLPEGTILSFQGVEQPLRYNEKGELGAWWIPNAITGNSQTIRFLNTDGGTAGPVIGTNATWGIGEIFIGRIIYLPTLVSKNPTGDIIDNTAAKTMEGGQDWPSLRKPKPKVGATVGLFTTSDYTGRDKSSYPSGGNPAGRIDMRTLRRILGEAAVCAVCDIPNAGEGAGTLVNGIRYDQEFMQGNWLLVRPSPLGIITMSDIPYWSWPLNFTHTG